jgi:hypothetical protein
VHGGEGRFDSRLDPRFGRPPFGHLDLREWQRFDPTTRVELALAERGTHVDVDDEQVLGELLRPGDEQTLLVEDERRAVEDELVLTADKIGVKDRYGRIRRSRSTRRCA